MFPFHSRQCASLRSPLVAGELVRLVGGFLLLAVGLATVGRLSAKRLALTDDYVIDSWQTEDGLPENSATAMVPTPDGFRQCISSSTNLTSRTGSPPWPTTPFTRPVNLYPHETNLVHR